MRSKPDLQHELATLLAHVPLLFSDRVEKARLLEPILKQVMALTGRQEISSGDRSLYPIIITLIPEQTIRELRGLRHADQVHIDGLEPIFGKGAVDWRLLLVLEAGYDATAKGYLDWLLSRAAASYDALELGLFAKAIDRVKRSGQGFAQPDKARATLYMLQRRAAGNPVKDGDEVEQYLTSVTPVGAENKTRNMARILQGVVLDKYRRREGRPKKTRQRKLEA